MRVGTGLLLLATAGCMRIAAAPSADQRIAVPMRDGFAAGASSDKRARVDGWVEQPAMRGWRRWCVMRWSI